MKAEFNIDDTVFYMDNNKVQERKVSRIIIDSWESMGTRVINSVVYGLVDGWSTKNTIETKKQEQLFKTKQALLDTI